MSVEYIDVDGGYDASTRALIEECRAALAEELSAWDIDPPLHHVKQAHDKCVAWLAASPQEAQPAQSLSMQMQQMCSDWGTYWRASDAHGVDLTQDQALELLRFALGVEVEIKTAAQPPQEAQPAEPKLELGDKFMEILRAIHGDMPDAFADSARLAFVDALKEASEPVEAQPVPEPLSDEQIKKLYSDWVVSIGGARAVERLVIERMRGKA
jgi:hypothetical protein